MICLLYKLLPILLHPENRGAQQHMYALKKTLNILQDTGTHDGSEQGNMDGILVLGLTAVPSRGLCLCYWPSQWWYCPEGCVFP